MGRGEEEREGRKEGKREKKRTREGGEGEKERFRKTLILPASSLLHAQG